MLNPASFITRTALEDFSIRASNEMTDFIADEVFTPVVVSKEKFDVYQYDTSNFRVSDPRKSSKAQADSVDYNVFKTPRDAQLHKLQGEYDPADAEQFDGIVANLEQDTALTIMERLMLWKELEAVALALNPANYPASNTQTLAANLTWLTGGDPEGNASTARAAVKTASSKQANAAAMSWSVFEALRSAPYFIDRMKYTSGSATSEGFESMLRQWLGVQYLAIGKAQQNANIEGNATQALTDVWDDSILFYVKNPSVAPKVMRFGANYVYNQMYTYRFEDPKRGSGKGRIQMIEQGLSYVLAQGAVQSQGSTLFTGGYLLKNVI